MRSNTRGFIPLVAIVLLGLMAVAGGVIATVSIRHNGKANAPVATSTEQAATSTTYSAPVRARVESSGADTTVSAPEVSSTPVATIVRKMDADTAKACGEVQSDLRDVKINGDGSGDLNHTQGTVSLLKTVADLCNALKKPSANTPDGDAQFIAREAAVKQQFALYK